MSTPEIVGSESTKSIAAPMDIGEGQNNARKARRGRKLAWARWPISLWGWKESKHLGAGVYLF
jgi:hypothetical protein